MASLGDSCDERERWDRKYREAPEAWLMPDPFLARAFERYIAPQAPSGGRALDLAGGAGRHAIWLARRGWDVTVMDISEVALEQTRTNAGPVASHLHPVLDDLTTFTPAQKRYGLVMVFFYLQRQNFPEIVKAVQPGGWLIYKTYTLAQAQRAGGPKDPAFLLVPGELPQLAAGMRILHYQKEEDGEKATAELVAAKLPE